MLYNTKNGVVSLAKGTMDYIRFGKGTRILIMLPGLGDGLRTVKGTALPMSLMYRKFAKDFLLYRSECRSVRLRLLTYFDMYREQLQHF